MPSAAYLDPFPAVSVRKISTPILTRSILPTEVPDRGTITVCATDGLSFLPRPSMGGRRLGIASEHCSRLRPRGRLRAKHARAVSGLSHQIGAELGLGEQALKTLALAAFLHDLGKNAVPEAILRKPGPLTLLEGSS